MAASTVTVAFSPAVAANAQHSRRTSCLRARPVASRASAEREGAAAAVQARPGRSIKECEADAVASKFPALPPPKGTPEIRPLVHSDSVTCRCSSLLRVLNFGCTIRVCACRRWRSALAATGGRWRSGPRSRRPPLPPRTLSSRCSSMKVYKSCDVGVNSFVLFPKVPDGLKTQTGDEAYNDNGLVPRTICLRKDKYPDIVIYIDVALDPYSINGHDGIVREDGVIMNGETVHQLCKQAVSQARAGADVVNPSDMMDGRVGAIRAALNAEGFHDAPSCPTLQSMPVHFMAHSVKLWIQIQDLETRRLIR